MLHSRESDTHRNVWRHLLCGTKVTARWRQSGGVESCVCVCVCCSVARERVVETRSTQRIVIEIQGALTRTPSRAQCGDTSDAAQERQLSSSKSSSVTEKRRCGTACVLHVSSFR